MMDLDNIPDTQTEAEELEEVVMGLIINSGQARSLAYAALKQAKQGDFAAAKAMMDQSRMALNEAHLVQTKLIECNQVNHLIPTRVLVKGGEITCKMLK